MKRSKLWILGVSLVSLSSTAFAADARILAQADAAPAKTYPLDADTSQRLLDQLREAGADFQKEVPIQAAKLGGSVGCCLVNHGDGSPCEVVCPCSGGILNPAQE